MELSTPPAVVVARELLRAAAQQVRAAREADWPTVYALGDRREQLLQHLGSIETAFLTDEDRATLGRLMTQLKQLDAEIERLARSELERLSAELQQLSQARQAARGYRWASGTRDSIIVDRYG